MARLQDVVAVTLRKGETIAAMVATYLDQGSAEAPTLIARSVFDDLGFEDADPPPHVQIVEGK